jgi:hypothetical protein
MKSLDEISQDIGVFIDRMDELTVASKRELLLTMFKKHLVLNSGELVLDRYDFYTILSRAGDSYAKEALPKKIGDKEITSNEVAKLFIVEATIELLNNKGALNRLPKFDRR